MQLVPTISLADHLNGGLDPEQDRLLAKAREDHGFFLLTDHGEDALIDAVFTQSAEFFALPKAAKQKVARDERNPLGYFDRELTKQKRDQKEVFDFKAGGYISRDPADMVCAMTD